MNFKFTENLMMSLEDAGLLLFIFAIFVEFLFEFGLHCVSFLLTQEIYGWTNIKKAALFSFFIT